MQDRAPIRILCYLLLGTCLAGCAPAEYAATSTPPARLASPTFTAIATFTTVPSRTPSPTETPAPTTGAGVGPLFVETTADNVNLRTRPGTVFPVSRLLKQGTHLQLLGHAPGGEWLNVRTDDNINGWILAWLVKGGRDGGPSPLIQPQDVQVIQGIVVDRAGVPVSGIGFAVTQGSGPNAPRTDATSDSTGHFYAYLPTSATGAWLVSYVSVSCSSNTMDASCNCVGACGTPDPGSIAVILPSDAMLQFTWK